MAVDHHSRIDMAIFGYISPLLDKPIWRCLYLVAHLRNLEWVITPVIRGLSRLTLLTSEAISHLLILLKLKTNDNYTEWGEPSSTVHFLRCDALPRPSCFRSKDCNSCWDWWPADPPAFGHVGHVCAFEGWHNPASESGKSFFEKYLMYLDESEVRKWWKWAHHSMSEKKVMAWTICS